MKLQPAPGTRPGGSAEPVLVRPMRRRDLRSVLRIDAEQVHEGWSVGLYLAELKRVGDRRYVVARTASRVVGFAGVLFQSDEAHVTTISVERDQQGRRIGTRLLHVLVTESIARGCDHLTLEVRAANDPAIALYRRFGLGPAGIRRGYYPDTGEDALIMWAHDLQSLAYADRLTAIAASLDPPLVTEGLDA